MQNPNVLLAILGRMAQKPDVKFDNLYPKLFNTELWLMAYESIAPNAGNMTAGVDGKTIDGVGTQLIETLITGVLPHVKKVPPNSKPGSKRRNTSVRAWRAVSVSSTAPFNWRAVPIWAVRDACNMRFPTETN